MEDVEAISDRIILIDNGTLRHDLSLNEFKKLSKTNLIDAFDLATKGH